MLHPLDLVASGEHMQGGEKKCRRERKHERERAHERGHEVKLGSCLHLFVALQLNFQIS
jgi:hypothetical protein